MVLYCIPAGIFNMVLLRGKIMKNRLFQIAMSVTDIHKSIKFYNDIIGFVPVKKPGKLKGMIPSRIQGHKNVNALIGWMNCASPLFHLEFIQYFNPQARPMPPGVLPCDIGYSRMGICVADFSGTVSRLKESGVALITEPQEFSGGSRVCVRDPDGVYLELMEKPVQESTQLRPGAKAAAQYITASVPDLKQAVRFFSNVLGMERIDAALHTPEMEALWGLPGAGTKSSLLKSGDILVELVEYLSPRGRLIPEERNISDAGLWHVAMLFDSRRDFMDCYRRALDAGHYAYSRPVSFGFMDFVYMKSSQGFTVEFAHFPRWMGRFVEI